jgi:predicted metal-dependent peptidase
MTNTQEKLKSGASLSEVVKDAQENRILNLGTDCAINQYIPELPTHKADEPIVMAGHAKAGEPMGVYPETFDLPREHNADFYIDEIRKKMQEQQQQNQCQTCQGTGKVEKQDQSQQGQGGQDGDDGNDEQQAQGGGGGEDTHEDCPDCNGTGQQQGKGMLDDHSMWGQVVEVDGDGNGELSPTEAHDIDPEFECQNVVMKAIEECKDFGKLPAHIQREIERLTAKPRHNWKQTLRVFVNSVLTVKKKLSQKRVNKRFMDYEYLLPGKKKSRKPKLAYVRDTSGSMFDDEVQAEIANELANIAKRADVFVLDADTKVQKQDDGKYHYKFKKPSDLRPYKGGGGTCFIDAFDKVKSLGVDGVIYATDTYGSFPSEKDIGKFAKSTIWLTFGQDEVSIPFGRHVNINPEDFE